MLQWFPLIHVELKLSSRGSDDLLNLYYNIAHLKSCSWSCQQQKGINTSKYDIEILNNPDTREKYSVEITNRFQLLADTERTPNELWDVVKETIHETVSKILGQPKPKPKKPWIRPDTFTLIDHKDACDNKDCSQRKLVQITKQRKKQFKPASDLIKTCGWMTNAHSLNSPKKCRAAQATSKAKKDAS